MATADVIKEFLVSLGFKVDDSSLRLAQRAMGAAEGAVTSFASSSITNFAKAETGVIAFVAAANIALGRFIVNLAQSDLQTEMFARRMWMSKDAAKAYQSSIDALGVSINDLYLSPELMQKYLELNKESRGMAVPTKEYGQQMQGIRDITFQFQRLKLEGTYALQWIGYYLTKYLAGPMGSAKDWLTKINDTIQKKMPEWTKKVAEVASWFVRLGVAAWSIRGALLAVLGVFGAFKMINMLTNPLGMLIFGMTALLLLVDDFNTYTRGGKSAFPELWKWVNDLGKSLEESGLGLDTFKNDLLEIKDSAKELGKTIDELLLKLGAKDGLAGVIKYGLLSTLLILDDTIKSINMGLKELSGLVGGSISIPDIASGRADKKFESSPEENGSFPLDDAVFGALKGISEFFTNAFKKSVDNSSGVPQQVDEYGNIVPTSFKGIQKGIEKIAMLLSYQRVGMGSSNLGYLYPQSNTSHMTQITLKPTYNIHGVTQPAAVAQTVHKTTSGLIRYTQGGVR